MGGAVIFQKACSVDFCGFGTAGVWCEERQSDEMGSACGCLRWAEKSLFIVVSVLHQGLYPLIPGLSAPHTVNDTLVGSVVSQSLARALDPVPTLHPPQIREVPSHRSTHWRVHIHCISARKWCG